MVRACFLLVGCVGAKNLFAHFLVVKSPFYYKKNCKCDQFVEKLVVKRLIYYKFLVIRSDCVV